MKVRILLVLAAVVLAGCNLFEDSDDYGPQPCEIYCNIMIDDCTAVFDGDYDACLDACAGYPEMPVEAPDGSIIPYGEQVPNADSLECRIYHAENVLRDGPIHCAHASPEGGGVCVGEEAQGICGEYCRAMANECPNVFSMSRQCAVFCTNTPPGDPNDPAGDTIACRLDVLEGAQFVDNLCSQAGPNSATCVDF